MHYVLQENVYNENGYESLIRILERTGTPHTFVKVIPFVGELIPEPVLTGPVVCFGTYSMRNTAKKNGWTPGVWDLEEFDYATCIEHWKLEMLNHDSITFNLKDFGLIKDHSDAFYRPSGDNKHFSGGIKTHEEMKKLVDGTLALREDEVFYGLQPDTKIIRSSPKEIYSEYRTWFIDGKLVTASQYKQGDRVLYSEVVDEDILKYARDLVSVWNPAQAFVLDVCRTSLGLKAVEINTINAAGFYAADMGKIFEAIENLSFVQ